MATTLEVRRDEYLLLSCRVKVMSIRTKAIAIEVKRKLWVFQLLKRRDQRDLVTHLMLGVNEEKELKMSSDSCHGPLSGAIDKERGLKRRSTKYLSSHEIRIFLFHQASNSILCYRIC